DHRAAERVLLAAGGSGQSGRAARQRGGDHGHHRRSQGAEVIHATAVVDRHAELDSSAEVGPCAVIGPKVKIGPRTRVGPHAVIEGDTTIGADNVIFQFASVGAIPQDLKYGGEPTKLVIGDANQIREIATVHS